MNGQWVSGDRGSEIVWDLENAESEKLKSWVVKRKDELTFAEVRDRAEWGTLRFTGPSVSLYRSVEFWSKKLIPDLGRSP